MFSKLKYFTLKKKISWEEKACQKWQLYGMMISTVRRHCEKLYVVDVLVSVLPKISEFTTYSSIITMTCPHFLLSSSPILPGNWMVGYVNLFLEVTCVLFSISTKILEFVVYHGVENSVSSCRYSLFMTCTGKPAFCKTGTLPALLKMTAFLKILPHLWTRSQSTNY